MSHDVFVCYDERDKATGEEVCHVLEANKIRCWIKSRDYSRNDSVDMISKAIRDSKCLVLVYSKNSKNSNIAITEVDIAFSSNVPIIAFNIDKSKNNGDLEFFLKNKPWIDAFPNPAGQLKRLVRDTSQKIGKPVDGPEIPSKSIKYFKSLEPPRWIIPPRFLKIAVPIAIILILAFVFIIQPMGHYTTDEGNFTMNLTDVEVNHANGMYFFIVHGESYNMPENSNQYIMKVSFLDENNSEVYSLNASADEFKSGVICNIKLPENNVRNVTLELVDLEDNTLCKDYCELD